MFTYTHLNTHSQPLSDIAHGGALFSQRRLRSEGGRVERFGGEERLRDLP